MFDSPLIDVTLSLFAMYALLSLFCTASSEAIASIFMMRARYQATG